VKKRTLVSKLRDAARVNGELKGEDLVLAVGGIPTITEDGNGKIVIVGGDAVAQ
jgi:hypothetical protein